MSNSHWILIDIRSENYTKLSEWWVLHWCSAYCGWLKVGLVTFTNQGYTRPRLCSNNPTRFTIMSTDTKNTPLVIQESTP